jgi:hypothetical protein
MQEWCQEITGSGEQLKKWRKGIPINSGHKSMGKEKRVEDKR